MLRSQITRNSLSALLSLSTLGLLSLSDAAQPQTVQGRYSVKVPAGAKSLVISRSGMNLEVIKLSPKDQSISFDAKVTPARYRETITTSGTTKTSDILGPFSLSAFKDGKLSTKLNTWVLLWSGAKPGTSSFSYSLNGKTVSGKEADHLFRVRLLFSAKPAEQIKVTVAPPYKP